MIEAVSTVSQVHVEDLDIDDDAESTISEDSVFASILKEFSLAQASSKANASSSSSKSSGSSAFNPMSLVTGGLSGGLTSLLGGSQSEHGLTAGNAGKLALDLGTGNMLGALKDAANMLGVPALSFVLEPLSAVQSIATSAAITGATDVVEGIGKGAGDVVQGFGNAVTDLGKGDVFKAVGDVAGGVAKGVGDVASGVVKGVGDAVGGVVNGIGNIFKGLFG